jgi:hypothetical protein
VEAGEPAPSSIPHFFAEEIMWNRLVLAAGLLLSAASAAAAEEAPDFTFAIGVGMTIHGPAQSGGTTLRALGFSDQGTSIWPNEAFLRFDARVPRGGTLGLFVDVSGEDPHAAWQTFRARNPRTGESFSPRYELGMIGLRRACAPARWASIGGGPAVFIRDFYPNAVGSDLGRIRSVAVGWFAGGDLFLPVRTRGTESILNLFVQYRNAGAARTRRYEIPQGSFVVSWPATLVSYSHWAAGIGIGRQF